MIFDTAKLHSAEGTGLERLYAMGHSQGDEAMMTPDRNEIGIYLPDNEHLDGALASLPPSLRRYQDHARLLLHFISVKRWLGDLDGECFARLNADILRQWIPARALAPLKRYLVGCGLLETAPHASGLRSAGYRIAHAFDGPPRRHVLENPRLAGKLKAWRTARKTTRLDPELLIRRRPLLDHLHGSLQELSLPASARTMMDSLRGQVDPQHAAYVLGCIQHNDHDGLSVDGFGWRVHSLVTRTSSSLRRLLLLGGNPIAEVDIGNSQPLLLAILLGCAHGRSGAQHIKRAHNIVVAPSPGPLLPMVWGPEREKKSFLSACESGELYDLLAEEVGTDRDTAKRELFRDVLFGRPQVNGRVTKAFGRWWPSLLATIRRTKKRSGYKSIAQALQRMESLIVLDSICPRLLAEFPAEPFLTVHDSALVVAEAAEAVRSVMVDEFRARGVTATIRVKGHNHA